ncbi:hypothetical protein NX786_23870 [Telluria mixta]|uniref:Uncharacterized protein n=1 Tax=Telluria mixta TaxID=34071 RepID=A0ABT2C4Q7_9BURK|nr:hypothetical protein [Telluria mixta]MCS0632373.1 hypothetical protein [Telluria mixta]WEM94872.1 hypothetical protein P0M04_25770 [Telluria mixta]
MKTQLLQDFQESGSAPASAGPPAPPPPPQRSPAPPRRPAVWHGPGAQRTEAAAAVQKADPGALQRAPETSARGKGVAIEALADRIAAARTARAAAPPPVDEATLPGSEARPRPEPPPEPPPVAERHDVPHHIPHPIPPPQGDAGTIPRPVQPDIEAEWLAARLREDAAAPAWSSMWKRRLVTWSIAGGLLAGLAAGGLWLYEENRVEDALVVVANTSPAGQPPVVRPFAAASPPPAPVQAAVVPEAVKPVPAPAPEPVAPAVEDKAPESAEPVAATPVDVKPPRRAARTRSVEKKRTAVRTRRPPVQEAPPVAATQSPRQRREETLMQCRAHGYDARQCIERACTMTRYGLACKG